MRQSVLKKGFTLIELIIVVVIIGILAAFAMPQFAKTKERALGNEARANLKLIQAAEKIYRMEMNTYYPALADPPQSDVNHINDDLKLSLTEANWDYSITGGASTFTASAARNGTSGYLDCEYTITQLPNEPAPNTSCP